MAYVAMKASLWHVNNCHVSAAAQAATFKRLLEAAGLQTESSETLYLRCLQRCRDASITHLDSDQRKALRKSLAGQDPWWQLKSDMAEMLAMLPIYETTDGAWTALYGPVSRLRARALFSDALSQRKARVRVALSLRDRFCHCTGKLSRQSTSAVALPGTCSCPSNIGRGSTPTS